MRYERRHIYSHLFHLQYNNCTKTIYSLLGAVVIRCYTYTQINSNLSMICDSSNVMQTFNHVFSDDLLQAVVILSDTKWDHVAVVWNSDMSSLQVFVNGELRAEQTVTLPSLTNGSVAVHSTASEGKHESLMFVINRFNSRYCIYFCTFYSYIHFVTLSFTITGGSILFVLFLETTVNTLFIASFSLEITDQ